VTGEAALQIKDGIEVALKPAREFLET